jgi:hypothetical protein
MAFPARALATGPRRAAPCALAVGAVAAALVLGACDTGPSLDLPAAREIEVPAGPGGSLPHVAADGGTAILSWVEPADSGHALHFARWDGSSWTASRRIAAGTGWFVNWADFPSVVALGDGSLAAHWLQRSGAGTYAYDVMIVRSADDGRTWSAPFRPHSDGTATEHGFVSLFPIDDALGAVWLDGRKFAGTAASPATNEMKLRVGVFRGSDASAEALLDERACDCCQTAVALTSAGPLVAWRDRSEDEIRDIAVSRLVDGRWTEPAAVHADGWQIDACPVNGPQADARGAEVAIAWFTAAADTPRVLVAFSGDAGATFDAPIRVDGGDPLGRVDVVLTSSGALVVWLERTAEGADVRARMVTSAGRTGAAATLAETRAQRPSGFPRLAQYDGGVLLAWTEPGDTSRVRAAVLELD